MKVYSLIDITETKKHRNNSQDSFQISQQANFMTFAQTLMLRRNILFDPPICTEMDIKGFGFGADYTGKHKVWETELKVDEGQYLPDTKDFVEDFDLVPVIDGLNETIQINNNVFRTKTKAKNIIFK
jgi:hypothetical protein